MAIPSITCPLKQVNSLNGPQVKTLVDDNYPTLVSAFSEKLIRVLVSRKWAFRFPGALAPERRQDCLAVGIYLNEISSDSPLSYFPFLH